MDERALSSMFITVAYVDHMVEDLKKELLAEHNTLQGISPMRKLSCLNVTTLTLCRRRPVHQILHQMLNPFSQLERGRKPFLPCAL